MLYTEVVLGMKVVPHSKTAKGPGTFTSILATSLDSCSMWQEAKRIGQPYLIVVHQHTDERGKPNGRFLLNTEQALTGNYYMPEDFEPYVE